MNQKIQNQTTQLEMQLFQPASDFKSQRLQFRKELGQQTVEESINKWIEELETSSINTAASYGFAMRVLAKMGAIPLTGSDGNPFTLDQFKEAPHERVIDQIKRYPGWAEETRQSRASAYVSFTRWLCRLSEGWIRSAEPKRTGAGKTFYKVREKVATKAISLEKVYKLLNEVSSLNKRDGLIARATFGGARRISEVLGLKVTDIDFDKNLITYNISKTKGTLREVGITYSKSFMEELSGYIKATDSKRKTSDYLFITCSGKTVGRQKLNDCFTQASKNLGWLKFDKELSKWNGYKASPHTLRTSWITHMRAQNFSADDISEVTAQSIGTVQSYDKRGIENNISRRMILI